MVAVVIDRAWVRRKIDLLERQMEIAGEIPTREEIRAFGEKAMAARERLLPRPSLWQRCLRAFTKHFSSTLKGNRQCH